MLEIPRYFCRYLLKLLSIKVPSSAGAKVFLIQTGYLLFHYRLNGGRINHLGAKMRKLHCFLVRNLRDDFSVETSRGSAVIMPHTSVHISSMVAFTAAAMIAAV